MLRHQIEKCLNYFLYLLDRYGIGVVVLGMPIKKPNEKVLQIVVKIDRYTKIKIKSALAGMTMTEFVNSAIENYTPEKK